jgi:integrase
MGTLLDLEWTMLQSEVLVIPPEAIKGRKKGEVKFLPPVLRDCLADSRPPTAGRLWPWPHCPRHFQTCWGRLRAAAACRPIGFHGLRRAHLSLTRRLSAIDHGNRIAQVAAGHSDVQTTLSFYLDPEDEFELLKAAVLRMPSPFPETLIAAPAPMEGPHEDHDRVDPANP